MVVEYKMNFGLSICLAVVLHNSVEHDPNGSAFRAE